MRPHTSAGGANGLTGMTTTVPGPRASRSLGAPGSGGEEKNHGTLSFK